MSRRLIYVAFWEEALKNLVTFLKEKEYSQEEINHLETILVRKEIAE